MQYDWDRPLLPGTVICAKYGTFNGEDKVGIFVVLYDEQTDGNLISDKNVIALKVSTKDSCITNYSVPINRKLNDFMNEDCIICCSKLHLLHKKYQVYKVLGTLHPATYHNMFKVYSQFNNQMQNQLIMYL